VQNIQFVLTNKEPKVCWGPLKTCFEGESEQRTKDEVAMQNGDEHKRDCERGSVDQRSIQLR